MQFRLLSFVPAVRLPACALANWEAPWATLLPRRGTWRATGRQVCICAGFSHAQQTCQITLLANRQTTLPLGCLAAAQWYSEGYLQAELRVCGMQKRICPPDLPPQHFYRCGAAVPVVNTQRRDDVFIVACCLGACPLSAGIWA